jgi:hypothetical protein
MRPHLVTLAAVGLLLTSCTSLARQVSAYPGQGQIARQIQADTAECTAWAESATDYPGQSAVTGAVVGGVILAGVSAALYAILHLIRPRGQPWAPRSAESWGRPRGRGQRAGRPISIVAAPCGVRGVSRLHRGGVLSHAPRARPRSDSPARRRLLEGRAA